MKSRPEILYEDDDLLIVNKPAGLLSIPDRYIPDKPNLLQWLRERYGDVITVHRLDKGTSGVICYARHPDAHRHVSQQFEKHEIKKIYTALLDGVLSTTEGTIDQPIARHPSRPGQMMVSNKGKAAITHYRVVETFQKFTLVEAEIETGRTHQIRVHFQSIGRPLAVDAFYGSRKALLLSEIKGRAYRPNRDKEERPLLSRLSLHASRLTLMPFSNPAPLTVEAPLPKDLAVTIKQLRKWG